MRSEIFTLAFSVFLLFPCKLFAATEAHGCIHETDCVAVYTAASGPCANLCNNNGQANFSTMCLSCIGANLIFPFLPPSQVMNYCTNNENLVRCGASFFFTARRPPPSCNNSCVTCCSRGAINYCQFGQNCFDGAYRDCYLKCECPGGNNLPIDRPKLNESPGCYQGSNLGPLKPVENDSDITY